MSSQPRGAYFAIIKIEKEYSSLTFINVYLAIQQTPARITHSLQREISLSTEMLVNIYKIS
jgi:hypothetical protein